MKKLLGLIGLLVVCLLIMSCTKEKAESKEELNIEQKIGQLQENIQELAVKIETNPESEEAGAWREEHQKYINEIEELKASFETDSHRGELTEAERIRRAMQEYRVALEQYPDDEDADKWRETLHELELQYEKLGEKGEVQRFPEIENALKNKEEQLHEMELYLVDLREKGESEEKIKAAEEQMDKIRNEKKELQVMLEKRRQGIQEQPQPSAYQREQGELEAYVISATKEAVTVRVKDSEKVMVFRIPLRIRVEGERIENTEMIKLASKLKKDQLIWVDYREGEERGSYFAVGMKKLK